MTDLQRIQYVVSTLKLLGSDINSQNIETLMNFKDNYGSSNIVLTPLDFFKNKTNELFGRNLSNETANEIIAYIKDGQILSAVKRYKELTGAGLKEAKEFCDNFRAKLNSK